MDFAIVVHGGAGAWLLDSDRLQIGMAACRAAAEAGQRILLAGGTALAAVETAVRLLEDCPVLDAGTGSYINRDGEVEMDALIMDGRTLDMGAVATVRHLRNPITLARHVLTDTPHNLLVGLGAEAFALSIGLPHCTTADLITPDSIAPAPDLPSGPLGDTVGAVALDSQGNLAAATSTGGTRRKMPGRVGDSPLPGCGGYADNQTAAVSATGEGEALMKMVISKRVCDLIGLGFSAQAACEAAISQLAERTQREGGLIAIDSYGRIGIAYNTTAMPHAKAVGSRDVIVGR